MPLTGWFRPATCCVTRKWPDVSSDLSCRSRTCRASSRGGVLITALIFVAVIGISLTSYLALSRTAMTVSHRAVYLTAAHDLAETGLEEGLWALNRAASGALFPWSGWTTNGSNATRNFTNFTYNNNITGQVKVLVQNYNSTPPSVVARSIITLADGTTVERWLRITTTTRSLFAYGLLARDTITLSGGAFMDSWISDPDNDPSTAAVPWSNGVALDNTRIATMSTATPSISIGSADVYGKASVGAGSSAGLAINWGGQVGPRGMPISGSYNLASGALSTGFSAAFETVDAPSGATVALPYVLPRNVIGPPWYLANEDIGTDGTTTVLQMNSMSISGAATLTIRGDVTIHLPPSIFTTLSVGGSGKIVLAPGASLKIYTPGDIDVAGAGITNPSAPERMQIWSTRNGASGQSIRLRGSGALNAVIYAPDAALSLPGSTDFSGAAVVESANLTGSGAFHYDESLVNFGEGGSLTIDNYDELDTPTKRAPFTSLL